VAEVEEGYCFVDWTDDVGTIADVKKATITMQGNYEITTNLQYTPWSPLADVTPWGSSPTAPCSLWETTPTSLSLIHI